MMRCVPSSPTWSRPCTPRTASASPPTRSASRSSVFVFDCPDDDHVPHRRRGLQPGPDPPRGRRPRPRRGRGRLSVASRRVRESAHARTSPASTVKTSMAQPIAFEGSGVLARCLQHETRPPRTASCSPTASRQKVRKRLYKDAEKFADEFPPGWPVAGQPEHVVARDASRGCELARHDWRLEQPFLAFRGPPDHSAD